MSFFQLRKRIIPNTFNGLHLKDLNINNDSYHEIIDDYSDKVIKLYEKDKDFYDIIPDIQKGKRLNFLYKRLIYKGMKFQSPFMIALRKTIEGLEIKDKLEIKKEKKFFGFYKLSSLKMAKMKLKKLEKARKFKLNALNNEIQNSNKNLTRCFSDFNLNMTSKTPKFNLNSSLNDSNYSFNNKNLNMTNQFSKNLSKSPFNKELSTYYKSDTNFKNVSFNSFNASKMFNKPAYLIDKCLEEIDECNSVIENMTKKNENFSRNIKKQVKVIDFMEKTNMLNLDTFIIKKYQQLEKVNMDEIKKKLDEKISDTYAYNNRKMFNKQIKNSGSINAAYIYLHDIEKTNDRLENQRNLMDKKIRRVENLCKDEYNKIEYLKRRINMLNKKHKSENKIRNIKIKNDFFTTIKKSSDDSDNPLNGGFLPKLLELRKKFINEMKVGELKQKKKITGFQKL